MHKHPHFLKIKGILFVTLLVASGHVAAACVDGFNPKSGKPCGGGGDDGGGSEPVTASCSDVYFGGTAGKCTAAVTGGECMLSRFNDNTPGWRATEDCDLSATLETPASDPIIDGQGYTFNLVAPWSGGDAGFTNGSGNFRIANLTVNVADATVAAGCAGVGTVQTAIWINQDAPDSGVPRPQAAHNTIISSGGARFCNAIEYRGEDPQIRIPQFAGGATGNTIAGSSYERAAISLSDLNLTDNVTGKPKTWDHPVVHENVIEGSCIAGSVGIYIGPNVERGQVERNVIGPGAGGCGNAIGIFITDSGRAKESDTLYDFLASNPISVKENNIITDDGGGSVGIFFDANTDATTASNVLTAGDDTDTGFCIESGAGVDLGKGKNADDFTGFGTNIDTPPDC